MTSTVVSLVVALVGIPVVLLVLSRRRFWDRHRGPTGRPAWGGWRARHGLTDAEAVVVARAVHRGRELDDPRLRSAAVDWARIVLADDAGWRRPLLAVVGFFVVANLAVLGFRLATGRPLEFGWGGLLVYGAIAAWIARRRRGNRRAIELNSG